MYNKFTFFFFVSDNLLCHLIFPYRDPMILAAVSPMPEIKHSAMNKISVTNFSDHITTLPTEITPAINGRISNPAESVKSHGHG